MFSDLITAPATPVLTTAEAKDQARIDHDEEDTLVARLVATATAYFDAKDGVTGDALISQTWRLTLGNLEIVDRVFFPIFPARSTSPINLPITPAQSITSIKYYLDGALETLDASNYRLINGEVYLTDTGSWPAMDIREDALQIEYVAGYGDAASDIAQTTRHGIAMMVAYLYEHREAAQEKPDSASLAFTFMLAASRSARGLF